jgi:hypothetical protein
MKAVKSERLRKLEGDLQDLEQWLQLGLVPKKDLEKHKEEMRALKEKIEEEKERLQFLKEGGEAEEFSIPKRTPQKPGYSDAPTIPDIDLPEGGSGLTETGFDMETYVTEDTTADEETAHEGVTLEGEDLEEGEETEEALSEDESEEEEDESYFSDKNRWRRGGIVDPDADEW